jgi:hypothetical protein
VSKSGKLSEPGDSGIVSLRGVEWPLPLVGGPHTDGERPSCAWISRALYHRQLMSLLCGMCRAYRFGNRRLPNSFVGEPAPARPVPAWLAAPLPSPLPNGYLKPDPAGGSIGELEPEAFADRFCWAEFSWPRPSRFILKSGRAVGAIMDYMEESCVKGVWVWVTVQQP